MSSKFKDKLKQLIDDEGVRLAADRLGLSITDVVRLSEIPIDSNNAFFIINENLKNGNLPKSYKEFRITLNNDEEVYWEVLKIKTGYYRSDISEVIGVFATPFYDGNLTKVDLDWYALIDDDDESTIYYTIAPNYIKIIKTKTPFQNVDDLFTWYNEFYLPEVYKSIFSLLPKARKNIEKKYEVETQGQFRSLRENIKRALREVELTEKCWKGYTQKGMKTMFGKRYPNCVKKTKK